MSAKIENYAKGWNVPFHKTMVITGGNSGVGFELIRHVLRRDYRIIMAVRNIERGNKAREKLLEEFPSAQIEVWNLDLASLDSIHSFCDKVIRDGVDFDVFYCNAGVYRIPYQEGPYGIEMTAWVNFVANYVLYEKLREYAGSLPHQVRWIQTSSVVARFGKFKESDFFPGERYNKIKAYENSKVAVNGLFLHMVEDCKGTNILPLAVHPGTTHTPLIEKAYPKKGINRAAQIFVRSIFHSPEKASLSTLYVLREEIQQPCFCGPRGLFHMSGYPKTYRLYKGNLKGMDKIFAKLKEILAETEYKDKAAK